MATKMTKMGRVYAHRSRNAPDRWIQLPGIFPSGTIPLLFIPAKTNLTFSRVTVVEWSLSSMSMELVEVASWME